MDIHTLAITCGCLYAYSHAVQNSTSSSSHHESLPALTQINDNMAWTIGEKEKEKEEEKDLYSKFNFWKCLKSKLFFIQLWK